MTWRDLESLIDEFYLEENIKIPYSHYDFDTEVEPPHLMSSEVDFNPFGADNKMYYSTTSCRLELTTDTRDKLLEKRIENEILSDIYFDKEVTYIKTEKVWNVSYFFELQEDDETQEITTITVEQIDSLLVEEVDALQVGIMN